jgi:hypothetical protein
MLFGRSQPRNMPEPLAVITPVQEPSVAEDTFALIRHYVERLAKILDGTEQQPWKEEAKRLYDEAVLQPITIVLAGRTGAGKSSIANAVMQNRLLPSSSEVGIHASRPLICRLTSFCYVGVRNRCL